MVYSIIKKSQLEGALRLDAEYYQPEYLNLMSTIKFQGLTFLGDVGVVSYGTTPDRGFFENEGIPFVRSQNFSNIIIDDSNLVFCSSKFHIQNKKSEIKPGDILFAAVGATIGDLAIVQSDILEGNINQNIARVRITTKKLNQYFVGLFFASKYGQFQIERLVTGNAQPYLNSEQINILQVPALEHGKQNEIGQYFTLIEEQIKTSKNYYQQAENLLLEEFDLNDFKESESLFTIVSLSEVENVGRLDAEYFQEKYKKLMKKLKQSNGKKLGDLVMIKKGIEPGSEEYKEEGKLFIRVSSLSRNGINLTDEKYLSEEMYNKLKNDFEPKEGEILLTKDATPGIAYVIKDEIQGIMAGGILRLALKDKSIKDEYLALCLNSIIGQMQAERDAGGSVIMHWKPEQIKNVVIPILGKDKQQKIVSFIRQSFAARAKANELLEEAKKKVEEMIEVGEKI